MFVQISGLITPEENAGGANILRGSEVPVVLSKGPVSNLYSDGKAFGLPVLAGCCVFSLAIGCRRAFSRTEDAIRVVNRCVFQGRSEPKKLRVGAM